MAVKILAQDTKTISVIISDFPAGTRYAENEMHDLGNGLVIYTNKCHFTSELRIYSSDSYNGFVLSDPLPGTIQSMTFNMGYKKDVLNVYGSTDKENWTLVKGIETTSTSYKDYTLSFPSNASHTCFKLDVKGTEQIRIKSISITYISSGDSGDSDNNENEGEEGGESDSGDSGNDDAETIIVSAPIFTPISTSFSTESLDVTIEAAKGCEIYYTKDGTTPSYTNAEEYIGTKSNVATIFAADSKVILQAIAVDPTTGKCSDVSSATYTYTSIVNDGSKTKPYTVSELRQMTGTKNEKWVKGTICGVFNSNNNLVTSNFNLRTNIVIGNENEFVAIQLPSGSIRDELNLVDHPYLKGKDILVQGDLEGYLLAKGLGVKSPTEYVISYDVPINSYGYTTLFLDIPVSIPSGSTAYYCSTEGNYANLLFVGNIIPDSIGVIIESAPNTTCRLTYTTETNKNEENILVENQLVGFTEDSVIEVDGFAYYALNVKDNRLGFYIPQTAQDVTDATSGFTAKAYKAYLKVPEEQKATMFIISRGNDETPISPIIHTSEDAIYDLQGRIVSCPKSGVYIKAGKKVIIK